MIKKYILVLLSIICCLSCVEDETVDVTVMPDISNVGADTFGCLVDGWLYAGGRYYSDFAITPSPRNSIRFLYSEERDEMDVSVQVMADKSIHFVILSPQEKSEVAFTEARFGSEELENGIVNIIRFDKEEHIISGTFSGGRITKGRFDIHYKED